MSDLELRRQVAEARGYENVRPSKVYIDDLCGRHPDPERSAFIPRYETDIAAAWGLVEDMGGDCYQINPPHGEADDYRVVTAKSKADGSVCSSWDPHPAAAICKAWLKYMEANDGK